MPGPDPKHITTRQRKNIRSTRATLRAVDPDEPIEIPEMPRIFRNVRDNDTGEVTRHEVTYETQSVLAWDAWWMSPMRQEWTESDYYALCRLIVLEDKFWKGDLDSHSEIRLAQKDFGLTPLDRRRLEWTIEQADEAQDKGRKRRQKNAVNGTGPQAVPPPPEPDPRDNLDETG